MNSSPFDFLNPNTEYVDKETAQKRYDICKECDFFLKNTKQCKKCFCLMTLKVKLKKSECPIQKW